MESLAARIAISNFGKKFRLSTRCIREETEERKDKTSVFASPAEIVTSNINKSVHFDNENKECYTENSSDSHFIAQSEPKLRARSSKTSLTGGKQRGTGNSNHRIFVSYAIVRSTGNSGTIEESTSGGGHYTITREESAHRKSETLKTNTGDPLAPSSKNNQSFTRSLAASDFFCCGMS